MRQHFPVLEPLPRQAQEKLVAAEQGPSTGMIVRFFLFKVFLSLKNLVICHSNPFTTLLRVQDH